MRNAGHTDRIPSLLAVLVVAAALLLACARDAPAPDGEEGGDGAVPPSGATASPGGVAQDDGLRLFRRGELEAAEPLLQAALEAAPNDRRLLEALGAIYALSDRPAEAETLLRRVTAESPSSFGAWFYLARVLADTGRDEEALQAIREARRREPRLLAGIIEEALLLSRLRRYEEAEVIAREAIARDAGSAEAHFVLARSLRERGALAESAEALRRTIEIEPDHLGALSQLATHEMRQGNVEEAKRYREAHRQALAQQRVAERVRAPLRAGVDAFNRGDYETTLRQFEVVVRDTPDDPQVYLYLGSAHLALGHYDEARDALHRCLRLAPREERALTELGRLYALTNRFEEAFEVLQQAIASNPDYPMPHYILAGLHRARGEEELSRQEMRRFEELQAAYEEKPAPLPAPDPGERP
jgi:tetratricopeptide (TPR) repeat protein